jgi:iron complex outermembrane recepter protein
MSPRHSLRPGARLWGFKMHIGESCLSWVCAAAAITVLDVQVAQAQALAQFDLPPQSLADSLRAIGSQTSTNVLFDPPLVEGLDARALKGAFSLDQVLATVLEGTGLKHRFLDDKTVVISAATADATPAAAAQESAGAALEEVIVTAQKRAESLQDVPLSVSAVSADKLFEAGINKISDLKNYVPSFFMVEGAGGNTISIRRVSSGLNVGFEQSVGTYVDGLYHGRSRQASAPFLDLERVEVLRGSQSILFGKNSVAGALNITTARPTDSFEGSLSALYEPEYDEQVYTGALSGPITDRLRGRIAARYREYGGHVENLTRSRAEPNSEAATVRGWLEFDLSDNIELALKAERNSFDTFGQPYEILKELPTTRAPFAGLTYAQVLAALGADPTVLNNFADGKRSANAEEYNLNDAEQYGFFVDWQLGEHRLSAVSGYTTYDFDENLDGDFTAAAVIERPSTESYEQFSQEIRLASPTGVRFEYLGGLYWEQTELDSLTRLPLVGGNLLLSRLLPAAAGAALSNTDSPRTFHQDSEAYAAFLHASWNMTAALRGNVGVRWSKENKQASRVIAMTDLNGTPLTGAQAIAAAAVVAQIFNVRAHDLAGSRSEDHLLPSLSVEYEFADHMMAYASWSKGAKGGGFDAASGNSPNPPPGSPPRAFGAFEFGPEKATNHEVGTKMTLGGVLELNLAVYFTDFEGLQVSAFDGVGFNVRNAGTRENRGVEIDSRWQATPNLRFTASIAYSELEFTDNIGTCIIGQVPDAPDGFNCLQSGRSARTDGSASVDYRIPVGDRFELRTVLDVYHRDEDEDPDPRHRLGAYTKLGGQVSFGDADGRWNLALVGKNLTDELIMPNGSNNTPLAFSLFGTLSAVRAVEAGRSVALQGAWKF